MSEPIHTDRRSKVSTILKVEDINVYYGNIQAIKGISFHIEEGETLKEMYLYVKDIYGNRYKYKVYQTKKGNYIEEVIGEKANPYSYEHELVVQKTLCRVVGEN